MRLSLDALIVLEAIHTHGSFAAAADALHRVRSALTYTIQTLERDLNVVLFDRSGHRAKLTPAGEVLLQEGKQLLKNAYQIEKKIAQHQSGWEESITLIVDELISVNALFPLIQEFYQACPWTQLNLRTGILNGFWEVLLNEEADLAIGVSGDSPSSNDYKVFSFMSVDFVFAVAAKHPLAKKSKLLKTEEIMSYRAVVVSDSARHLPKRSTGILENQSVIIVPTMQDKINAQKEGLGVGYLPLHLIQSEIKAKKLIIKNTERSKSTSHLSVAWRTNASSGKALKWWIAALKTQASKHRL